MHDYPYLKDKNFLKLIDNLKIRNQHVRITALNFLEEPLQSIEGIVTSGSVNIDGNSAVRRTCNLSVVFQKEDVAVTQVNSILSLNKKIKLEVGIQNTTPYYKDYETIWFPLGIYIIISPSISHTTSGITVSLQLRDKMCLLNGDVSGLLPAAVNFNEIEAYSGSTSKNSYVYVIEGDATSEETEPSKNVLITRPDNVEAVDFEDDKYALILEAYKSDMSANMIVQPTIYQIIQELVHHFGGEQLGKIIIEGVPDRAKQAMQWIGDCPLYRYKEGESIFLTTNEEAISKEGMTPYNYGDNIGYVFTDFTYPGELIGDAGQSICEVLDKIKNTLGNYEYFYDVFGNFVFQEKQNFLNTSQARIKIQELENSDYLVDMGKGKSIYDFNDGSIISAYSSAPQYSMIKNDFIVWGIRKDALGNTFPIRYHLAIDEKPKTGNTYTCLRYVDSEDNIEKYIVPIRFKKTSQFPQVGLEGVYYRAEYDIDGKEIDKNIFYLYNDDIEGYVQVVFEEGDYQEITTEDWRTELYFSGQEAAPFGLDSNYYYAELANEWPKLYNIGPQKEVTINPETQEEEVTVIEGGTFKDEVLNHPSDLDFFLDFIDSEAAISEFSVQNIGRRQKVVSDNSVNCMFEPYIEDLVVIETNQLSTQTKIEECENKKQAWTLVASNIYKNLAIGKTYNGAYNMVRDLLYQYTSYNESVSLTTVPIYYLEPNVRISITDTQAGIKGDYMVNSISLPLGIESTMSLNCTKALERI